MHKQTNGSRTASQRLVETSPRAHHLDSDHLADGDTTQPVRQPLLSIDDLADHLQIPKATLYRWRVDGKGPRGIRLGKYVRYRPGDVDAWVDAQSGLDTD